MRDHVRILYRINDIFSTFLHDSLRRSLHLPIPSTRAEIEIPAVPNVFAPSALTFWFAEREITRSDRPEREIDLNQISVINATGCDLSIITFLPPLAKYSILLVWSITR